MQHNAEDFFFSMHSNGVLWGKDTIPRVGQHVLRGRVYFFGPFLALFPQRFFQAPSVKK